MPVLIIRDEMTEDESIIEWMVRNMTCAVCCELLGENPVIELHDLAGMKVFVCMDCGKIITQQFNLAVSLGVVSDA